MSEPTPPRGQSPAPAVQAPPRQAAAPPPPVMTSPATDWKKIIADADAALRAALTLLPVQMWSDAPSPEAAMHQAVAELYDRMPGAANRDIRLHAVVRLAVQVTEQRVREEMAAKYLESVNLLVAQHAAKMAEAAGVIEALERTSRQLRDDLEHNERVHLAAIARINEANAARIQALDRDVAAAFDRGREAAGG